MIETWKPIKDYEYYLISNLGNVYSIQTNKLMKTTVFNNRYRFATLCKNGKNKKIKVVRLVAQAFIPNPENLPCVNHKDENKLNDCVDNLEWCTYSYNINYGTANNRRAKSLGKKVCKIDINTNNILKIYDTIAEAEKDNRGCYVSNITKCCKHTYGFKTCGGYKWEYYEIGDI